LAGEGVREGVDVCVVDVFYGDRGVTGEGGCAFRAGKDGYVVFSCSEEGCEDVRTESSSCLHGCEAFFLFRFGEGSGLTPTRATFLMWLLKPEG